MRGLLPRLVLVFAIAAACGADGGGNGDAGVDTRVDIHVDYDISWSDTVEIANYYVAPDGDDANPGTEDRPFATVQRAHDVAQPGDLIYLRGGIYRPMETTIFRREGTADRPITLQIYPGESAVVDGGLLPEGDAGSGSTPTWHWAGAKHWRVIGPIHLTNGRGSGLILEEATQDVDFILIESSYNGQTAARAGHGFLIVEAEWADVADIRFIDCDAHHNANHRTLPGENAAENLYQHGDGFRIKSGRDVQLIGCRAWNNLDDGYDLVWTTEPVLLEDCLAAYTGRDDAEGSITGTPGWEATWGEGIKLGYTDDTGRHRAVRCLSYGNVHLGFRMDGGPYELLNCTSFRNGRRALGWDLGTPGNVITNSLDFETYRASDIPASTASSHNSWDAATSVTVTAGDFLSLDDTGVLGPRGAHGSLPATGFLRLAPGSDLIDAGADVGLEFRGAAPDLGCFESP